MLTKKEMKKLRRDELLEMLIEQTKQKDELQQKLAETEEKLQNREIAIQEAGTLADAALQLNAIFEAADSAASQYLENVRLLTERKKAAVQQMEATVQQMEEETRQSVERQLSEAKQSTERQLRATAEKCRAMEEETEKKCAAMKAQAQKEADAYWAEVSRRLEQYLEDHEELTEWLLRRKQRRTQEE